MPSQQVVELTMFFYYWHVYFHKPGGMTVSKTEHPQLPSFQFQVIYLAVTISYVECLYIFAGVSNLQQPVGKPSLHRNKMLLSQVAHHWGGTEQTRAHTICRDYLHSKSFRTHN